MTSGDGVAVSTRPWPDVATFVPARRVAFVEHRFGRTIICLRGEHDISTVDALSEVVEQAMSLDDANVEIDLSDVQYMSAATIGVIVRTREWLQRRDRLLVLRSPSNIARRLCDLCGLDYRTDPTPTPSRRTSVMPTVATGEAVAAGNGGT